MLFDIRLEPIICQSPSSLKNNPLFRSGQKWLENKQVSLNPLHSLHERKEYRTWRRAFQLKNPFKIFKLVFCIWQQTIEEEKYYFWRKWRRDKTLQYFLAVLVLPFIEHTANTHTHTHTHTHTPHTHILSLSFIHKYFVHSPYGISRVHACAFCGFDAKCLNLKEKMLTRWWWLWFEMNHFMAKLTKNNYVM